VPREIEHRHVPADLRRVGNAAHHDSVRAGVLCAAMVAGDVLLADRVYVDLQFLSDLNAHGVFFVLYPRVTNRQPNPFIVE